MIAKLRRRFIAVAMISIVVVMGILVITIDLANFGSIQQDADQVLDALAAEDVLQENGKWKEMPEDMQGVISGKEQSAAAFRLNSSKFFGQKDGTSSIYESRYFNVFVDTDYHAYWFNKGNIKEMKPKKALEMTKTAALGAKDRGYAGTYRYLRVPARGGTMYYFLDCNANMQNGIAFMSVTFLVFLGGVFTFFVLVWFLSKSVVYPVAESYAKQRQFITNAGHELKTPLSIIDSCTDVIEMENGESKWTEGIHGQVERLSTMTQELINMTKFEENDANMERSAFNLTESVENLLEPFQLRAEEEGLTLDLLLQENVMFFGNEKSILQVCSILADNALKYAIPNSKVEMGISAHRHRVKIVSANHAIGVSKGSHEEFFERFYRGEDSHNTGIKGYGIGLSMARTIVQAHGGRISAISEDGDVVRFEVILPNKLSNKDPNVSGLVLKKK